MEKLRASGARVIRGLPYRVTRAASRHQTVRASSTKRRRFGVSGKLYLISGNYWGCQNPPQESSRTGLAYVCTCERRVVLYMAPVYASNPSACARAQSLVVSIPRADTHSSQPRTTRTYTHGGSSRRTWWTYGVTEARLRESTSSSSPLRINPT